MGKKLNSIKIILYLVCFIALWAIVTDAWGYSDYIFKNDPYNIGAYIYGYVSRIIWVLPAIFLVIRHDDRLEYKYIIVGFVEEMVFRGWGYNSLAVIVSHRKAVLISTLLFVLLHWPAYFIKLLRFGVFDITGIITQSISALIWG